MHASIYANRHFPIGEIDNRIYGSFLEHLGRAIYGGIYDPSHPSADAHGFRGDVLNLVRQLKIPVVRYPGGNFVSGYRWEDGTGPRDQRPRRLDLAWTAIEPNTIGIDEFQHWAKCAGAQVMMAVNLGTRGVEDAVNLVEYCNFPGGTKFSDRRRKNGFDQPFSIPLWCLGNEMDGPWQLGHKTAEAYGHLAAEAGKAMKLVDPSIRLIACGSSNSEMPTFLEWEETVLNYTYDVVDYLSMHNYYGNPENDTLEYLGCSLDMDRFISAVAAVCDVVKARKRSQKTMYLAFDEWNVWFHSNEQDKMLDRWTVAPHQLEDVYTFEDALVVGCLLITLLRHADRVKIACLAQLVNVIAPIMTQTGGSAWVQTIFYPFLHASTHGRGTSLRTEVTCGSYSTSRYGQVPWLEAIAVDNTDRGEVVVFAVNRCLDSPMEVEIELAGFGNLEKQEHIVLTSQNLKDMNTVDAPQTVAPQTLPLCGKTTLPAGSWNVLRFRRSDTSVSSK